MEDPYAAEAAATNPAPAPRGWRNPYAAETASTHVITPEGAPFGQAPRWAPPTPWGPPVLPVRTQSEPWTSPSNGRSPRGDRLPPYGPGGYARPAHRRPQGRPRPSTTTDFDGASPGNEFSGDEGETDSVPGRAAERRRTGTIGQERRGAGAPRRAMARRRTAAKGRAESRLPRSTRQPSRTPSEAGSPQGRRHLAGSSPMQEPRLYWSGGADAQGSRRPAPSKTRACASRHAPRITQGTPDLRALADRVDHGAPALAPPAEPKRSPRGGGARLAVA